MKAAVFVTIWVSMALFVAGELGKRRVRRTGAEPWWAWPSWIAGALMCVAHIVLALAVVHLWSQDAAIRSTAEQTEAVFGFAFGRGIYVSYAFAAIWLADALWWKTRPASYFARPGWLTTALRAFFLLIIVNGAVIFTSPARQAAGIAVVLALVWLWAPTVSSRRRRSLLPRGASRW
jgi:hypothetical protein